MPREKPLFRDNLERLDKAFPNKEWLQIKDVKAYTGIVDHDTCKRKFGLTKAGISKVKFASLLS